MAQQGFGIPTPNEDEEGSVSVVGTVEVANDAGSPLPVSGTVSVNEPVTVDGTVVANQGAPGATAWPVDIGGATVSVSNLQQLSVQTVIADLNYDLDASSYAGNAPFAQDSLLGALALRFSTTAARDVSATHSDGTVLWESTGNTSLAVDIDFEDLAIDAGTTITISISTTTGACLVDVTLTAKIGTAALGGNPVLGEGSAHVGSVSIDLAETPSSDAFNRLRTSTPYTLFDSSFEYNLHPRYFDPVIVGTGTLTHLPDESAARMAVAAPNDRAMLRSHRYLRYQPGKGQLIAMTGVLNADGGAGTINLVRRSSASGSVVEERVALSSANVDPLDGTGPSGVTLDPTKTQIFMLDLQWLGVGSVRFSLEINKAPVLIHKMNHSNVLDRVYMRTGSLPVTWEVIHDGTNTYVRFGYFDDDDGLFFERQVSGFVAAQAKAICSTVQSEGGQEPTGLVHAASRPTARTVSTTLVPVIALRAKTTLNGKAQHGLATLIRHEFMTDNTLEWRLISGAVLTGAVWTSIADDSLLEVDVSATAISGGVVIDSGFGGSGKNSSSLGHAVIDLQRLTMSVAYDGTPDTLVLAMVRIGTTDASVWASMTAVEVY